jgi:hypothetical protein
MVCGLRYFSKTLSVNQLCEMIEDARNEAATSYGWREQLRHLTPTVEKDLSKVHFDSENVDQNGYKTLPNGLTYLGVYSYGDWEKPVFYIIYSDGKKLRGYIPKKGNLWNTDTNRSYGCEPLDDCDEDDIMRAGDDANAVKRGLIGAGEHIEDAGITHNFAQIEADIQERIKRK